MRAQNIIIEAEKFRADVLAPKGNEIVDNNLNNVRHEVLGFRNDIDFNAPAYDLPDEIRLKRLFDTDDDFFHVTSHIDQALKSKIVKGEYIELEKLLPRNDSNRLGRLTNETKYQMLVRDGETYWGPMPNSNKITNIRKWD